MGFALFSNCLWTRRLKVPIWAGQSLSWIWIMRVHASISRWRLRSCRLLHRLGMLLLGSGRCEMVATSISRSSRHWHLKVVIKASHRGHLLSKRRFSHTHRLSLLLLIISGHLPIVKQCGFLSQRTKVAAPLCRAPLTVCALLMRNWWLLLSTRG